MFELVTKRVRVWRLAARITAFYLMLTTLGAGLYIVGYGRVGGVLFGLFLGGLLSGLTYNFSPYSDVWRRGMSICIKALHRFLLLAGFFTLSYALFIKEGALIKNDFSLMDQSSGLILIAFGVIFSGVILGKGRFEPQC